VVDTVDTPADLSAQETAPGAKVAVEAWTTPAAQLDVTRQGDSQTHVIDVATLTQTSSDTENGEVTEAVDISVTPSQLILYPPYDTDGDNAWQEADV
jgi:hypothetical protein